MPTLEEINKWADDLERECPDQLPRRLGWFTRRLGIEPGRLLRLMGITADRGAGLERDEFMDADWEELVEQHEAKALWLEDAINYLLTVFQYNADALANRLKRPPAKGEILVPRPGGEMIDLENLDEEERERLLMEKIVQGGAGAAAALLAYLSQTSRVSSNP